MADAYSKIGWENSPSEKTPINMTNLNHMDEGIEKNRELISQLEEQIGNQTGTGLSTEAIDKLEEVGNYLAYTTADGGTKWRELITILRGGSGGEEEPDTPVEPDIPEGVTLTSISVTYTGGDVEVGTALTELTGITVTATYSDGSTATVTGYTLSGTIAEGINTITVSYEGKTDAFTVVGIAESTVTNLMTTGDLGIFSDLGTYTGYTGYYNADAKTLQLTPREGTTNKNAHLKITPFVEKGKTYTLFADCVNRNYTLASLGVDYSKTNAYENNRLANTEGYANENRTRTYSQFTVPDDAMEVYILYTTTEHTATTVTNVVLYEGALTEMP